MKKYTNMIRSIVAHYDGRNNDDLFRVGCVGLVKAMDNFDVTNEVRFSTYAIPMINGEIRRYLRDKEKAPTGRPSEQGANEINQL